MASPVLHTNFFHVVPVMIRSHPSTFASGNWNYIAGHASVLQHCRGASDMGVPWWWEVREMIRLSTKHATQLYIQHHTQNVTKVHICFVCTHRVVL